ncbi:hemerythrin domain-containing protein [Pedobacter sp. BS3]|uniref:hemerythrin domain-containing protein n=1 Tax=Pedobacter sp. BS3 TaxID=2567937 RepID=UPI0011ED0553|nr:hemerythrin domain-containing protein [Pedobacter sp. BS3]TZF84036.1 hemerythrin domain-containing protein [Pedobacter sp. BS3]
MAQKPIRRNENILELSREHHYSLLFCWKIRQGVKQQVALERVCRYVNYFWQQHLGEHFRKEEEILFSMVQDEPVQKAAADHQRIRRQIEALNDNCTDTLLLQLADEVNEHVRYEERILFPYMEQVLSLSQLEAVGQQLNALHDNVKDNYADEFWLDK